MTADRTAARHSDNCGFALYGPPAICTCKPDRTAALEAAQRIIERNKVRKSRPSLAELEAILKTPEAGSVTINPDGSIGTGESDALTIARAFPSTAKEAEALTKENRLMNQSIANCESDLLTARQEADRLRGALELAMLHVDPFDCDPKEYAAMQAALLPSEGTKT